MGGHGGGVDGLEEIGVSAPIEAREGNEGGIERVEVEGHEWHPRYGE